MVYLGIDLHSNCFTCCFLYENGKREKKNYQLNKYGLEVFYKHIGLDTYVIVEASTNTFKFVELIQEKVKEVIIANTHKLKLISMVKKKTDKIDAEKLAIYLKMQITSGEELINSVFMPEQTIQNLRALFTTYKLLKKHISSIKNRIHSILKQNLFPFTKTYIFGKKNKDKILGLGINEAMKYQIELLFHELDFIETKSEKIKDKIFLEGSLYYKQIDILTSMKGISVLTALAIIADIATIERFSNSKKFTSYLRSAPGVNSSNDETKNLSTNKFGRKLSITLLCQSVNHFRDSNMKIAKWYNNQVNEMAKKKGKVRMSICRKVFSELYQMLKKEEYHEYCDKQNHLKKMKEYNKFIEKNNVILRKSA